MSRIAPLEPPNQAAMLTKLGMKLTAGPEAWNRKKSSGLKPISSDVYLLVALRN